MLPSIIRELYANRFSDLHSQRVTLWRALCEGFLKRYVRATDTVLDLGAGHCEFINQIYCAHKIAIDLNEETQQYASSEVEVHVVSVTEPFHVAAQSVDVVFASHFFEHLLSKDDILRVLHNVREVLKPGGLLLILGPNIRYAYDEYWDFFDHYIPLSDKSMVEALQAVGYELVQVLPRLLPYTTKSRYPKWPILVRLYLRLPILYRFLGKQMFIVARRPS